MFPKVIYIHEEKDQGNSVYFVASEQPDDQMEGVVGVYALCETLHVRHKAQFRRPKTKTWFDKA